MTSKFNSPSGAQIIYEYYPGRLYLNITNRCTNSCLFCALRRNRGVLAPFNLNLAGLPRVPLTVDPKTPDKEFHVDDDEPDLEIIEDAISAEPDTEAIISALETTVASSPHPVEEVVFCGAGEPLIRLDTVITTAFTMKKLGITVRLNTNGHGELLNGPDTVNRLSQCIDKISISLNAQDSRTYNYLSRPSSKEDAYSATLDFSAKSVKLIDSVTLSVVAATSKGLVNSAPKLDLDACRSIADKIGAKFRLR